MYHGDLKGVSNFRQHFCELWRLWLSRRTSVSAVTGKRKLLTSDLLTLLTCLCPMRLAEWARQNGWLRNSLTLAKSSSGRQKVTYLPSPALPLRYCSPSTIFRGCSGKADLVQ